MVGRAVWGWSWAGLVLSGWLEAALAAGESFEAFEMRVINDAHEHLEQIDV